MDIGAREIIYAAILIISGISWLLGQRKKANEANQRSRPPAPAAARPGNEEPENEVKTLLDELMGRKVDNTPLDPPQRTSPVKVSAPKPVKERPRKSSQSEEVEGGDVVNHEIGRSGSSIREDFDIKKAVIYSEILKRKF